MRQAIQVATANPQAPFGAVLIDTRDNSVVSTGCNRTADSPIWHGEIDALHNAGRKLDKSVAGNFRLYTTAEPCCMCIGAILWAGIGSVVYGVSIQTLMELGWMQIDISSREVAAKSRWTTCSIEGGILAAECERLFCGKRD